MADKLRDLALNQAIRHVLNLEQLAYDPALDHLVYRTLSADLWGARDHLVRLLAARRALPTGHPLYNGPLFTYAQLLLRGDNSGIG